MLQNNLLFRVLLISIFIYDASFCGLVNSPYLPHQKMLEILKLVKNAQSVGTPTPTVAPSTVPVVSAALTPVGLVNGYLPSIHNGYQYGLTFAGPFSSAIPFQYLSTTRVAGTTALTPLSGATISTISVNFVNGVFGTFNLANIPALTPAILAQGLYVQVDIVEEEDVASFGLAKLLNNAGYPLSDASNSILVASLIDTNNNVYAAAGISSNFTGNPASYTVTLNSGTASQAAQTVSLTGATSYPAIFIQQVAPTPSAGSVASVATLILSPKNIGYAGSCTGVQGTFTPSSSQPSRVFNSPVASCTTPLTLINVGVTDAQNSCFLAFNFDTTILNQPQIQTLISNGLYVGVVCTTNGTTNTVSAVLMDETSNIYAQGTYTLAAGIGALTQYYVGFNTNNNNLANGTTSIGINAVPLNSSVLYKQALATSAVTTTQTTTATTTSTMPAALTPVGLVNGYLPSIHNGYQYGLTFAGPFSSAISFQYLSTTRVAGTTALTPLSGATISTISVNFVNGVFGTFNLANIPALTSAILAQGLYVQVDIVEQEDVASFGLAKLLNNAGYPLSDSSNSILVASLIDTNNNVYAAAGISSNFTGNPDSYTVTLNQGMPSQAQQTVALTGATTYPAIFIQQIGS